ncbi:MAG: hypothetical protein R3324_09275, partial [Halobacteriales archaeon]|nr:hypothetical protein [Halobacteriales archaeon]
MATNDTNKAAGKLDPFGRVSSSSARRHERGTVIFGVPSEVVEGETRVALIPPVAERLVEAGHDVVVDAGAGDRSNWTDDQYREAGCTVAADRAEVFDRADVLLQVRGLPGDEVEPEPYRDGQVVIGMLDPYAIGDELAELAARNVSAFALELMPRIGRAQSMDVLSSMASLAGYKAAIMAADSLPKIFPMEMTAAGTIRPAEV